MIKFAKIIINREINEYRNLHLLPKVLELINSYEKYLFDDYFPEDDLVKTLFKLVENSGRFFWAIIDTETGDLMGIAYFDKFIGNFNNIHSAEVNTCFFRKYWGNQVRFVAKKFIKYCFKKYDLKKIKASIFKDNLMVKGLLKYLGFKREGVFKEETLKNNKLQDIEVYSILRREKCKRKKSI